ncbi:mannan endo-1,4-beta-mannosidase [Verticillium alfalfae VaMs.102]|uniref:Mannan endo-1,4-beta-mannosidase A n=1 Tax=Verticillium alfalfae (strain VaMs.102 / ATCC MYA-4576 / FGSC 10136) TaxID=526221 RepID=C9SF40_VERA1|nr:mannan endo-1,4-beta-mannosidase [Verticillium alfalfae VaMs.102]EEY17826.1 mannan endo-1,4-beta-mannosidase [Verticillium alfalfae VaMs.102]
MGRRRRTREDASSWTCLNRIVERADHEQTSPALNANVNVTQPETQRTWQDAARRSVPIFDGKVHDGTAAPPPANPTTTSTRAATTSTRATTTLVTSTTRAAPPPATTTAAAPPTTGGAYVKTNGLLFNIDGVSKYFPGTNCYWCSVGGLSNADTDLVFNNLKANGLKILRVWGFNDVNSIPGSNTVWFQNHAASGSTINTGANGLQRLDYVVQAAERTGVKLIINFVNNWDDYGGIKAYTNAYGGTHQTWYTNTAAQAQYRRFVQAVVSRYTTSKAIFAWELANEPRCNGCNTDVIFNWAKSASEYVKSLDPNHLVTLGDEGLGIAGDSSYPYQFGEGTDFAKNLAINTLDFGTFHLYPGSWGVSYDWGNKWIKDHAAACVAAGKPCFFEEYGAPNNHCAIERPWQLTSVATPGMAADAFWQLGDTLSYGKSHDDGNTIYTNTDDWTCLVTNHVAALG